jgi:hypothetical protein
MFTSNVHVGLWRNIWIVTFTTLSPGSMIIVQQPADSKIKLFDGSSCQGRSNYAARTSTEVGEDLKEIGDL